MSVTQKEIANSLGLSQSMVARALKGYPSIAKSTHDKVLATAERMGYTAYSNQSARALIAQRYGKRAATGIIAVILPGAKGDEEVSRFAPYFDGFLNGIERQADDANLDVFLCARRNYRLPRLVQERGVDGILSMLLETRQDEERLNAIQELGLPLVTLDCQWNNCASVMPDSLDGIAKAVEHLVKLGHRRIAYLGFTEETSEYTRESVSDCRLKSFHDAMSRWNQPVDPDSIDTLAKTQSMPEAARAVQRLLRRNGRFTALVCYNDLMAMGAMEQLQAAGIRVPEDVSITGFDDISTEHGCLPALTSVRFSRSDMGRRAVLLLQELIDAEPNKSIQERFPVELVVRDSTAPANT